MCDQTPPSSCHFTPAAMPSPMSAENLRRMASHYWRLRDPVSMARAWDEPATSEVPPATKAPRSFGQLPSLAVPETFDDALPDQESGAWDGDVPP